MIERKFVIAKKQEFAIKEHINNFFGKGKISDIRIERTPVGEKIIIYTSRPGLIIGRREENLQQLTYLFKKNFALENPQIEVVDISSEQLDAKGVADQIALSLERFGQLSFKIIAYRALERLVRAGALGAEIILSGKLPSERARQWRFAFGYMQKTGESTGIVNFAKTTAQTLPGTIGIKVSIVPPNVKIPDQIKIDKTILESLEVATEEKVGEKKVEEKKEKPRKSKDFLGPENQELSRKTRKRKAKAEKTK